MKLLKFLLVFFITIGIIVFLSLKIGDLPPLGKFLGPFHGFWQNIELDNNENVEINMPGLRDKVQVYYDNEMIPHVEAENDHDLYFAQGYVTAAHRLWQMEFQTYAAAGRVSEIIGSKALDFDRMQRRKGMLFGAHNALRGMMENDTIKEVVEAYAAGVNAYINTLSYKDLSIEYKLLDYKPEPWTPLKTALLLKYMADDLSSWDNDLENTNAFHLLGEERFNFLFPDTLHNTDPIIPNNTQYRFDPIKVDTPNVFIPQVVSNKPFPKSNPRNGSNNWALAGNRTNTGKPILANDPHLALNLPSLWYVMQLKGPNVNVMGATLPGALGVIIGFNESIAWGVTNARRDVRDWYALEFKDERKNEYLFDRKWLKTQKVPEEIKIRGEKSYFDTVVYTHYGPVVYDDKFMGTGEKTNFSLRWIAHDFSEEQLTFYLLNRGKNYEDFKEAIQYFSCPAQNFVFASTEGDIALWVQGKFPLKWPMQGKFIMDGSRLDQEWQGYIPFEHNAHVLNPPQQYVSSANQYPVGKKYPYYVYDGNYETYRNRRINRKLENMKNATPQDIMALQNDNYHLQAAESLPMMLDSLNIDRLNEQQKEIYALLKNWDYFNDAGSKAATVYEVWWNTLYALIWDEFQSDSLALSLPNTFTTIDILKNYPNDPFIDIQSTPERETVSQLVEQAYVTAIEILENWSEENEKDYKWSNFQNTSIKHLLKITPFSIENVVVGGHEGAINAVTSTNGPSWRMVVSMEDEVKAWGIYPGGQSGNPGSPYYDNFVERWRKGEYIPLVFMRTPSDTTAIIHTKILMPSKGSGGL